jgi:hypothetical protein
MSFITGIYRTIVTGAGFAILLVATGCSPGDDGHRLSPLALHGVDLSTSQTLVTVPVDAIVTAVTDPAGVLAGAVAPEDILVGEITYDESVGDSQKKADSGRYVFRDPPSGVSLFAAGLTFTGDPGAVNITIKLLNDKKTNGISDSWEFRSAGNADVLPGVAVSVISVSLQDASATALDDDILAGLGVTVDDWTSGVVSISGPDGWRIDAVFTAFYDGEPPAQQQGQGHGKDRVHDEF